MHAPPQSPSPRRGRIVIGGFASVVLLGAFLAAAWLVAGGRAVPPVAGTPGPVTGPALVVRTPQHLHGVADVTPLVNRLATHGVTRAWVQVKQDESDEFLAGSALYASKIAPVADGFADGRTDRLITALAERGIEPMGWMPVLHDAQAARAHPEWRARRVNADGRLEVEPDWLCPFEPGVAQYEASIAREIAARFPALQGLYLDFIRYDDDYSCVSDRTLRELESRTGWRGRTGRALVPVDLRRAGAEHNDLWRAWTRMRAERIVQTVNTIRDAVEEVRPDFRIGAFVLPFSARDYDQNTQAGQDLRRMARAGLDEIVLMGYWDDWDRDPEWVREGLEGASELVDDEADLSVVLDGDMGVRRTRLTLQALGPWTARASWFNYGEWTEHEFDRLERAIDGHHREGPMPRPDHVSVVVRIDTEPDYRPSYATVHPEMIDSVVEMLGRERAPATFVTVGRLAELQTDAMRRVAAAGHEVASHSYNHEQIDSLPLDEQMRSVDRGLATLQDLGFDVRGFGARNSITDEARDRLMQWNLEYDGSAAYDPLAGLLDVRTRSNGGDDRILVIPFVVPNDWDARYIAEMSAEEMLDAWTRRLDRVVASGEPVFVLDVHQWSISDPDNLDALRGFIRYARGCEVCRVETLRAAARNARSVLDRYELPGTTSGAGTIDTPLAIPDRPRRQP